jgi:hypothetical protein
LKIKQSGIAGLDFCAEDLVGRGETMGAEGGEAGEEDIDGDLQAGLCKGEYIFWAREEKGFEEEGDAGYGEDEEGSIDCWRYGLNRESVDCWAGAKRAVIGNSLRQEDWPEEDEEGSYSVDH